MIKKEFDLIVIGTGAAGTTAAEKCSKAGFTVAMIDSRPFGGTCVLRGCDPKKVLVGAAEIYDWTDRMLGKGIEHPAKILWPELMAFKTTFVEHVTENMEKRLAESGIEAFHGVAAFKSENQIQVGDELLTGKHILIATGAKPMPLALKGQENLFTSDDFLNLSVLPDEIIFIGGGFISFEFAHIAARAGSKVHILHNDGQVLNKFDAEQVDILVNRSKEIGINIHLNVKIDSIDKLEHKYNAAEGYVVKGTQEGKAVAFEAGIVIHGAGRIPNLEELNLEAGNVMQDKRGVLVNEYLQSISNPKVYAAGDAASTKGLPLTPIAAMDSHTVASNLINGNHLTSDYSVIPTVIYTIPKLSSVGLTEEKAAELGYDCYTNRMNMEDWYTYRRTNEKYAMAKIIIDRKTKHILGAHLISDEADVLINYLAIAMKFDLTTEDLKKMIFAYPSSASDLPYLL